MNKKLRLLKNLTLTAGVVFAVRGLDNRLEVVHYTVSSPKLPEQFDDMRIVQLSDYHCDTVPGLLEAVRSETPDLILTTGDMADDEGSYSPAVRLFRHLVQIAPTFAVNGNHELWRRDYAKYDAELKELGVYSLHDTTEEICYGDAKLTISGIDDPFTRDGSKMKLRIEQSLDKLNINSDTFNILLMHRANLLDSVRDRGFDLVLAGHMHGGQFRLPANGRGILSPKSGWGSNAPVLFPKYFAGRYAHKETTMIVNRGLGNPMIIPRLFNRPEITVIKLKKEK
jgi:hypothetical protein